MKIRFILSEITSHIRYRYYLEKSYFLKGIVLFCLPRVFTIQLKYYMSDRKMIEHVCGYIDSKFLYQPRNLERSILHCLFTKRAAYRQYAFITHVLLTTLRIPTRLISGRYRSPNGLWYYHMWVECRIDGKPVYIDTLKYKGIIPEKIYETMYIVDKAATIALNVYFNEVFTAYKVREKDIWAMKSRVPHKKTKQEIMIAGR